MNFLPFLILAVLMLGSVALSLWFIVDAIESLRRHRRARTCGTCEFGVVSRTAQNGSMSRLLCIRYPKEHSVEADWIGCGESEER